MQRKAQRRRQSATKGDVKTAVGGLKKEMDTKFDAMVRFIKEQGEETRRYIDTKEKETRRHFDVVAENIHQDVAGAVADKIKLVEEKQEDHEKRITRVETTVGIL
jgi:hypothetical protein